MRWPRMTTRRLMILIAIVAIAFGATMMRRRSVSYRARANRYALEEAKTQAWAVKSDRSAAESKKHLREIQAFAESGDGAFRARWKSLIDSASRSATIASDQAENCHRWAAYWGALNAKYERAARRPWLAAEPDPPPPGR
jgi:hypothetical protein